MPEELATADRRATWTAIRSFRQRPSIVGRTDHGETVFELRSVRMLLPAGSSHFKRLVQCAKCGGEMAGMPLLTVEDLDRQPNPVFCGDCVRAAPRTFEGPPEPPRAERTEENWSRVPAVDARPVEMPPRLGSSPALDPEVAALVAEVAELRREAQEAAARTQLVQAQRGEMEESLEEVVRRVLATVGPLVKEVTDRQQALEEKLSKDLAEARAETLVLLAERAEVASVDDLAAAVERRLSEAQAAMTAATERAMEILAASVETGATRQDALERKLNECVERIASLLELPCPVEPGPPNATSGRILQALERQLRAAEERLARR